MKVLDYAKAIAGGLVASLTAAIPVVDDGLTPSEGLGIALAFIVGTGIVAAVPNDLAQRRASRIASGQHARD